MVLAERHSAAVREIDDWLRSSSSAVESLTKADLVGVRYRPVVGWRVPLEFSDGVRRVDVMVSAAFPFQPPRVRLVDRPTYLTWPHLEADGFMCLVPEAAAFDAADPIGGVASLLAMAIDLGSRSTGHSTKQEFQDEILSYWTHAAALMKTRFYSILAPKAGSRIVRAWRGNGLLVLGEDDAKLASWVTKRFGGLRRFKSGPALLLWLEDAMVPSDFPATAADIKALAEQVGATDLLAKAVASIPDELPVGLAMPTSNGLAIAGLTVSRPPLRFGRDTVRKGFRPNRMPPSMVSSRFFGRSPIQRADLQRIDPSWIHGRDQDPRAGRLREKTALILGCGSVGGPIAISLAQAGVGNLVLVDPDILKPANLSRHPLGAPYLGLSKASCLAGRIQQDLPHVSVRAIVARSEDVLLSEDGVLAGADVIVSAMADWGAEAMLDEWHQSEGRRCPVIYGWTEPHACAGHAVAILQQGNLFTAGFDAAGLPLLKVTEWPGPTVFQEPACGAVFQPYGPVELQGITALVTELSLDCLLGEVSSSTHRIWAGRKRTLDKAGGRWSDDWKTLAPGRSEGGFILERPWAIPLDVKVLAA